MISGGRTISAFPPWQEAHPRTTVPVGCMVSLSVAVWQDLQPRLFSAASSCDLPKTSGGSSEAGCAPSLEFLDSDCADCAQSMETIPKSNRKAIVVRAIRGHEGEFFVIIFTSCRILPCSLLWVSAFSTNMICANQRPRLVPSTLQNLKRTVVNPETSVLLV
jgi:hypothetical protein